MADQPGGVASTDSGFSSSCRRVANKARAEPLETLVGRPRSWVGRSAPRPTRPGVWPTWSTCQIHPHGDDDFDIWSTSICHPLKCSNLVPKFLKSNKHSLLDFYPFASAWNHCNKPKIDAITCYCNSTRLVGARSKLSSSNIVHNIFLVWLQMIGYCNVEIPFKI
jgi:hypothetical protein